MPRLKADPSEKTINQAGQFRLVELLLTRGDLKNDAALSRALDFAPPVVSKVRNGVLPVGPGFLLRAHEVLNVPVADMRQALAQRQ
jgi:hypothetical protein